MKKAYSVIANFYDTAMTDFDYKKYYDFVKCYLTGKSVELACGSGTFTKFLVDGCDSVLAVDNSEEMLELATETNFKNRKYIQFVLDDMQKFEPPTKVNCVISVCDGFNYIAQNNLQNIFYRIFSYLKNDGYFIFDISSEYKLKEIIGNNFFYDDNDNYTYLWTNKTDEEKVQMELAIFLKNGEVYNRFDEEHTQYIHKTEKVKEQLEKVGFIVKIFDGENFCKLTQNSKRVLFVCKKNNL